MPGIMGLRYNFRGGGADMGTVSTPGREARDEGAIAERMAAYGSDNFNRKAQANIQIQPEIKRNQQVRDFATSFLQRALVPFPIQVLMAAQKNLPQITSMINTYYGTQLPTEFKFTGAPKTKRIPGEGADQIQQTFQPGIINLTLPQQEEDNFDEVAYEEQLRRNIGLL